ncbi:MAG: hypothetical protein GX596_01580 [Propionibacterium sp.]|nr:hypothetical protein [Propionibacterium sp.]
MRSNDEMLDEIMAGQTNPTGSYDGGALRDLARAVDARAAADSAILEAVYRARDDGATWQMIGDILGMTKQGAAQRFSVA